MSNFKVGDIVLLREETSRKKWPMGREIAIQKAAMDLYGVLISCWYKCVKNVWDTNIERPANKLVLPIESEDENNIEQ